MAEEEIRIAEMIESTELSSGDNFVIDNAGTKGTKKFPYTELLKLIPSLITEWQSLVGYPSGYLVIHEGKLYQNKTDSTVIGTEWQGSTVWEEVSLSSILYIIVSNFVHPYSSDGSYRVGDLCIKNYKLYKCKEATTGTWSASKWDEINIMAFLINTVLGNFTTKVIESGGSTFVEKGEIYIINNRMWKAIVDTQTNPLNMNDWESVTVESLLTEAKQQVLEDVGYLVWENTHYYNRGDIVVYGDYLYVCKVDEATYGSFVRSDWKKTFVERWGRDLFFDISSQEMTFSDDDYTLPYSKGDVVYRYYPHPSNDGFEMRFYVAKADYPNGVTEYVASQWDEYLSLSEVVDALNKETNKSVDEALVEGTASGEIATFTDGSTLPMRKLEVAIEPQQDLHGYDNPWVGGSGKNKCNAQNPIVLSQAGNIGEQPCVIPSGTYTYSWTSSANTAISLTLWKNGSQIGQFASASSIQGRGSLTFTISSDADTLKCYYNAPTTISDIQVESGSTATPYAPYSNICPISGWDECKVSVEGINLWDEEVEVISDVITSKNYIPVKPNTQYYFTPHQGRDYICFDRYYNVIKDWTWLTPSDTILTTPSNCYYIKFRMTSGYGTTYNNDISINYPSTDTSYHAYNGQTYTIDLDGTRYGGKVDLVSGIMVVDRVIVTFDDSGWTEGEVLSKTVFQRSRPSAIPSATNFISNFIKRVENLSGSDENVGYFGASYFNVYVPSKTLAEWKTLLSSTNMEVVYPISTPVVVQLTPTEVKTLLATNNIFADTGDILDATYIRNANITINDLIRRIEALES